MNRPATSRDVARVAGVSQSAVSLVMTGKAGISAETRQRVLAAAARLQYRPNLAARSMRTRQSGRLAVVLPATYWNASPVLAGATRAAQEAGYALEFQSLPPDPATRQERLSEIVASQQYEGVLSFTPFDAPDGDVQTPVLSLAAFDEAMHNVGELSDAAPLVEMMLRLFELGHRRFLHVTGALDYQSARSRRDAYLATVERLGVESLGLVEGDWSGASGRDAVHALPEDARPLAVIAANDIVAAGVLRGAYERGWSAPRDVSVTGWDNTDVSSLLWPSLTTVFVDVESLGAHSIERLIAKIHGREEPPFDGRLQRVIWRESTAAPGHPVLK